MNKTKLLGAWGETIAKQYLINNNYSFVAQNYKSSYQELDLIFRLNEKYFFIEVKTRTLDEENKFEAPLSKWQTKNIQSAIINYCLNNYIKLENTQLDLIVIMRNEKNKQANLKHYRDILH